MQANEILIPARRELQDDYGTKHPDLVMFGYLADGIAEMLRVRPDLLLALDGTLGNEVLASGSSGTLVRLRYGRLEVWDEALEQWLAVKFEHGAMIPMSVAGGDVAAPVDPDGVELSWDTEIGIDDLALVAPLVDYVVYKGLKAAGGIENMNAALPRYESFRARLGVNRE